MNFLVGISHPKQVHMFKHVIAELEKKGHRCCVVVNEKECTGKLLSAAGIDHIRIGVVDGHVKLRKQCGNLINEQFSLNGSDKLFFCGAGNGSFNVSFDGFFRLCSSLWAKETIYDLKNGTLAEAWNKFVPKVRDLRSQRREFIDGCRKCALFNLCLWCPAHGHLETGALDGFTPYFCEVAHARAKSIKKHDTGK